MGDLDEAQLSFAEWQKRQPSVKSMAQLRAWSASIGYGGDAEFKALWEKTVAAGLRCIGLPEE